MVAHRLRLLRVASVLGGIALALACGTAAADPPSRVARMANIGGAVSFSPAGEDEWVLATPNRPLITGDRVWADDGARAELQIGALAARLGSLTSVTILNLDDRIVQFELEQGTLNVRVRRIDPGQIIEIDTPLLAFSLKQPGDYRIDVDAASAATTVSVRSGEGEAYGDGAAYAIGARQWYRFADSALRDYLVDAAPAPDAFDAWTRDRDRREDNPVSARYVSPDVIGYSDLDSYGTWSVVEGYGNVWVPTSVASSWAPYREGHWAWIEPWGWTWVDDAPWGFAPFHYGRWAYARERWCWVPGPVRARAVYAPALVAFVGGNNFRVSVGNAGPARGIAWFPLAPGEVYRPGYTVSRNYFTNVNVSNTNVTNTYVTSVYNRPEAPNAVYRNRDQRGGVTAVPVAAFVQSRPVAPSAIAVSRDVALAGPVTPIAAIAPVRASVIGGLAATPPGATAGPRPVGRPPASTAQRPVIARIAPPPRPAPFSVREAGFAKDPGRPADPATVVTPRTAPGAGVPAIKLAAPAGPGAPPPAPTVARPRTNAPAPVTTGGAPPAPAGGQPAPPRRVDASPLVPVQPPPLPAAPPGRPGSPIQAPKADVAPSTPPAPPPVRVAPPQPQPTLQPSPTPVRVVPPQPQPMLQPAPPQPPPPKPADIRPAPGPAAPAPGVGEVRRDAPPPPVASRPPVPTSPPAEPRREPPPAAVVRPPAAVTPPAVAPSPVVIQPVAPAPMVRPPVAAPATPPAIRQPEIRAQPAPAKSEPAKAKPDDKRDDPK